MNIFVSGGGSGLGKSITVYLASQKNNFVYFSYCQAKDSAEEIQRLYPNTKALQCDFNDEESVDAICNKMPEMKLEALINNAYTPVENNHFHKLTTDVFKNNFCRNILPTIKITQQAITCFRKMKFGRIITITTSFLVNKPPVGLSTYVAEKAYLASLCKSWATENMSFNITSNCLAPSMMLTNFTNNIDERIIENAIQAHPFKSLLLPEEMAEMIGLLLAAPRHVNGATWVVNGGADVI